MLYTWNYYNIYVKYTLIKNWTKKEKILSQEKASHTETNKMVGGKIQVNCDLNHKI